MDLYDIIADNYSRLFPLSEERTHFVKSFLQEGDCFLDIGCATGDLCVELEKSGFKAHGIDLNSRMINIACAKSEGAADFRVMNMLDIDEAFADISFPVICCFGNTLPHLHSFSEITDFFKKVYFRLQTKGIFIFQILNYDRILKNRKCNFPEVNKGDFIFTRTYEFLENKIRFIITMEINGKKISDSTLLLALPQARLLSSLENAGFNEMQCYRDYSLKPSDTKEFSTLYVAQK